MSFNAENAVIQLVRKEKAFSGAVINVIILNYGINMVFAAQDTIIRSGQNKLEAYHIWIPV
jgi:hypothetical protein